MNWRSNYFDWVLVIPIIFLMLLGLVVIWSLVPQLLPYQIGFMIVSALVFLVVSQTDYKIFEALYLPIYVVAIVSLLLPFIFGFASRGAHRWLQFGNISVQPAELVKPFLLVAFAMVATLSVKHKFIWLILAFLVPSTIIFVQPDLGTTLVLGVGWLIILISQIGWKWLVAGLVLLGLLSPLGWGLLKPYQRDRLLTFTNPYNDPLGNGYHVIQAVIAVGSGQLSGRGLGQGPQSNLRFLPERHTDFIFASLSEDLGFVGAGLVIGLISIILWRVYRIAALTTELPAKLLCEAVLVMFGFQTFVNIGMNMGLVPVTGITLPFLSYGGSSLLSLAITFGLVHSISRRNSMQKTGN